MGEDIEAFGAPASPHGFSQLQPSDYEGHPVVKICQIYWGRNERLADLKPGETIVITANNLTQTDYKLYFFEQYRCIVKVMGGPSRLGLGGFPKVSLTGRRSLGDIGENSDRGRDLGETGKASPN